MGLLNAGFTLGLAMGAPLAGLLEPHIGWVSAGYTIRQAVLTEIFREQSFG